MNHKTLCKNRFYLFKAYVQLIERFGWKSYTILYEDNQGLVRLQELLKSPTQSDVKIVVRQLPQDEDYRYTYFEENICLLLKYLPTKGTSIPQKIHLKKKYVNGSYS